MENKEHIEAVIERTFKVIQKVYENQREVKPSSNNFIGSYIIFPQKREEDVKNQQEITRVSEQELKQIFIEQLNLEICKRNWNVYYSVETPTKDIYRFSDVENPLCGKEIEEINKDRERNGMTLLKGQSANFDFVIHDSNFKRIALIEFKANNASEKDHAKDFKKLNNQEEGDNNVLRYFIEIVRNANRGTIESLHNKTKDCIKGKNIIFKCCLLAPTKDYQGDITQTISNYNK